MKTYVQKNRGFNMRGLEVPRNCYCGKPGKVLEYIMDRYTSNLCMQHAKEAREIWEQHLYSTDVAEAA